MEVGDELCRDIAQAAFAEIMKKKMTDDCVCIGLHEALNKFRINGECGYSRREHPVEYKPRGRLRANTDIMGYHRENAR